MKVVLSSTFFPFLIVQTLKNIYREFRKGKNINVFFSIQTGFLAKRKSNQIIITHIKILKKLLQWQIIQHPMTW